MDTNPNENTFNQIGADDFFTKESDKIIYKTDLLSRQAYQNFEDLKEHIANLNHIYTTAIQVKNEEIKKLYDIIKNKEEKIKSLEQQLITKND